MAALFQLESGLPQQWLPDETLFSLCSRYHKASGNRLASTTCKALFGHPQQGSAHDFPARLDHFSRMAGGLLGTPESIIEKHTILPLYLRFATADLVRRAILASCEGSVGSLKFQLGLLTSAFRANHPLKACPICMREDAEHFATAYWHREHQLPGLWVCRQHGCRLLSSDLKATGVSRFHWILPSASQFQAPDTSPVPPSIFRFGHMVAAVGSREGLHLGPDRLSQAFRLGLDREGFLKGPTQCLRREAAGGSYAAFLKPLVSVEQLNALPSSVTMACADLTRQLGPRASAVHPLRRLALAAWLFEDLDDLLAIHSATLARCSSRQHSAGQAGATSRDTAPDARKKQFFSALVTSKSLSAAARSAGIDTTTAMAWCASQGISTPRRPKILKPELRAALTAMLRKGIGKREVAEAGKVSLQTITTLLRTEVGLHEEWKLAGFKNAQRHNRRRWVRTTSNNPISGVKAARMKEPSVYAWLYRNDRDWLSERTNEMAKAARSSGRRVDWDTRDSELSIQVRQVALHLVTEDAVKRIKLFQLYQKIPELKAKLSKLDRLPLTRSAIYSALGKS